MIKPKLNLKMNSDAFWGWFLGTGLCLVGLIGYTLLGNPFDIAFLYFGIGTCINCIALIHQIVMNI